MLTTTVYEWIRYEEDFLKNAPNYLDAKDNSFTDWRLTLPREKKEDYAHMFRKHKNGDNTYQFITFCPLTTFRNGKKESTYCLQITQMKLSDYPFGTYPDLEKYNESYLRFTQERHDVFGIVDLLERYFEDIIHNHKQDVTFLNYRGEIGIRIDDFLCTFEQAQVCAKKLGADLTVLYPSKVCSYLEPKDCYIY